ncbi:hypothetical protein Pint_16781 [Pistacia integerrima]|uniref:Uncharacterized protein n=1 Tax=Pistacia integerrima TaxID=434235 RepID=A0ACC0ZDK4_9ROSI|nr:hypothetical protein Pint_16781 [Pistacia integerrima]
MSIHLKLILVALFASLAFDHSLCVFLSIDCGSSESYTDENSIEWVGDDAYIQNGESKVVQFSSSEAYPMSTLRVFPTGKKKNCYTIKVDEGERVLVRASFNYDNYDGKLSPPTFDLQFDGNFWATVNTSTTFSVISHEAIYVVKRNFTSICVAQTHPGQLPFISALEIRSLDANMYGSVHPNFALLLVVRAALGANETNIRYPVDPYDRIWEAATGAFGLTTVSNEASSIKVTTPPDNPPPLVLQNAKAVSASIVPTFGAASEVYIANRIASASNQISLLADDDSTLPPLINAMEVYTLSGELTNGTNAKDVVGLGLLQNGFEVLKGWNGDPCLPSPYSWDWIDCNSDDMPRVTAVNLSGYDLAGSVPDFSSMDALQTIDLSDNNLDGPIPDFLGNLPESSTIPPHPARPAQLGRVQQHPEQARPLTQQPPAQLIKAQAQQQPQQSKLKHPQAQPENETPPLAFQNTSDFIVNNKLAMTLGVLIQLLVSLSVLIGRF